MAPITVDVLIQAPRNKVWECWIEPAHIVQWNFASPDWMCPRATNDTRPGGKFSWRMEAKDGSAGFDFEGTYTAVTPQSELAYVMADGRAVRIEFLEEGAGTRVRETFDPETENSLELQRTGWQSILDNFKHHVETA